MKYSTDKKMNALLVHEWAKSENFFVQYLTAEPVSQSTI